jgi:hypothetical protein
VLKLKLAIEEELVGVGWVEGTKFFEYFKLDI